MPDAPAAPAAAAPSTPAPAAGPAPAPSSPPAPQGGAAPVPEAPQPRTYKLKVNGAERDLPETDLLAYAQKGAAADERFRELSRKQKEIDALQAEFGDPEKAIARVKQLLGPKWKEITEQEVIREHQASLETPEQKTARENAEKVAKYEREEAERKAQEAQRAHAAELAKATAALTAEWSPLIEKLGFPVGEKSEPATAHMLGMMADRAEELDNQGVAFTPEQLAVDTRDTAQRTNAILMGPLKGEPLLNWIGDKLPDIIEAASAKMLSDAAPIPPASVAKALPPRDPPSGQFTKPVAKSRDDISFEGLVINPPGFKR